MSTKRLSNRVFVGRRIPDFDLLGRLIDSGSCVSLISKEKTKELKPAVFEDPRIEVWR